MITTANEFYSYYARIQDENAPSLAVLLPGEEPIYNVNLNTRVIDTPDFLSVSADHLSETIYFKVDRYFDNVDLTTMTCVIRYINADGEGGIYPVPYYDVTTLGKENKIIFPWVLDGKVAKKSGKVQYSIRFYKINLTDNTFTYSLNTKTSESLILYGMKEISGEENFQFNASEIDAIYDRINQINSWQDIYWIDLDGEED